MSCLFHILPYMFKNMFGFFFYYIEIKKRSHLNHTPCGRGQYYPQLLKLKLQITAKVMFIFLYPVLD